MSKYLDGNNGSLNYYVVKKGNISPCGKFESKTVNPYGSLWAIRTWTGQDGFVAKWTSEVRKVNIDDEWARKHDTYMGKEIIDYEEFLDRKKDFYGF